MRNEGFLGFLIIAISIVIVSFVIGIGILVASGPTYPDTYQSSKSSNQYDHITPVSPTVPVSNIWTLIR
jgi:uncharacterized membrane protein YedE/YeeE